MLYLLSIFIILPKNKAVNSVEKLVKKE